MNKLDQVLKFLRGQGRTPSGEAKGDGNPPPPLSAEGRQTANRALHQAMTPRHADETHILFRSIGEDGDVTHHSEEWHREGAAMKAITNECLVTTVTGDVVSAKDIKIQCCVCKGYDTVGSHCRCGIAICRLHTFPNPVDGNPNCPPCYARALAAFDTWAAKDRQTNK